MLNFFRVSYIYSLMTLMLLVCCSLSSVSYREKFALLFRINSVANELLVHKYAHGGKIGYTTFGPFPSEFMRHFTRRALHTFAVNLFAFLLALVIYSYLCHSFSFFRGGTDVAVSNTHFNKN